MEVTNVPAIELGELELRKKNKRFKNKKSSKMIENKSISPQSRTKKKYKILENESSDQHKTILNCENASLDTTDSEKEGSPYKSPTVLSFDAYGNLTSSDDPDAPYSHEVPSLAEFDYILGSFEGRFKKEIELEEAVIPVNKNGAIKKNKHKKIKHDSGNGEAVSISDKDLKQVFKKDFDTSVSVTSRYGRTRKQKAQDGFLFGTINFNELRKITSSSPKKNRHSSASEGKSDSDTNGLEDMHSNISRNFETLSDKIEGYSSEDEFIIERVKHLHSKRRKTLPANIESIKEKESIKNLPKVKRKSEGGLTKNKKPEGTSAVKKRLTRSKVSVPEETNKDSSSEIGNKSPNSEIENFSAELDENLLDSLSKENKNIKKIVTDASSNLKKQEAKEMGSIQEDVNIIKSSLAESETTSPPLSNEVISEESNDLEIMYESPILSKHNDDEQCKVPSPTPTPIVEEEEIDAKIIEMETLNEEVKPEDALKTKYGRQIKKPILIDLLAEHEEEKKRRESLDKEKNTSAGIEELVVNQASVTDLQMEKLVPCLYFIGDIVWVLMKGNPMWPGMVTYPKNETVYTKVVQYRGSKFKRTPRMYHVQFFYDNHQTMWVTATNIFAYEGLPKLITFLEGVKRSARGQKHTSGNSTTKNLIKVYQKMVFSIQGKNSTSKTAQWYHSMEEADEAAALERYERVQKFKPKEEKKKPAQNEAKKRKLSKTSQASSPKPGTKSETGSEKGKSSDDFSGFDEDSSMEKRKLKKIKLDDKLKHGSFEVYLQKHLDATIEDSSMSSEKAKEYLKKKWASLSVIQRARYKSKLSYDPLSSMDTDESSSDISSQTPSTKPKKNAAHEEEAADTSRGTYRILRTEKVCVNCETVSLKAGTDMIKCKGVCSSLFHLHCVGLDTPPSTDFKCANCLSGIHQCFICKAEEGEVIRCSVASCGKFYHDSCVRACPQVSKGRQADKLVCPRHVCHMCAANADDMNDPAARTPPFTRCMRCPTTYHTGETCVAAGADEISQNYHICTKHMKVSKNNSHHFNVNWCFCCSKGGSLLLCDQCPAAFHAECMNITAPEGSYICEDCENGKFPVYGDIVWVKLGAYRWWPGEVLHPRYIPDNIENLNHVQGMFCVHFFGSDDYYWLSRGRTFHYQEGDEGSKSTAKKFIEQKFHKALEEAVIAYRKQKEKRDRQEQSRSLKGNLKPPPYVRIDTNKPVGNVRLGKLDPSTVTRCDCDPYSENPCASDNKCINRMLMVECIREICAGKDRCNNQRFQRRQYPNLISFKTSGRGWGLKTKDPIAKGEFVIEYVGELIDDAEFRRRIDEMHDYKEQNYYFLTVETDRLVDAGPKGNLARFMNHSCQPNCETQKWTVGADTRVGLFALEDIPEGSELTFNYNLECVGTEKKKCNCGAPNCSGFIGVKVQKPESSGVKKLKLENGIKKRKKNKKKKTGKDTENECFRCGQAGDLILCDMTMCPKGYHLECLGLKELPKGKWLCPWHHCDECGSRASNRCIMCPNSYCRFHSSGKFHPTPGLGNICMEHGSDDFEALRGQMGADSISRPAVNTALKCPPEVTRGHRPSKPPPALKPPLGASYARDRGDPLPASLPGPGRETRGRKRTLRIEADEQERVLRAMNNNNVETKKDSVRKSSSAPSSPAAQTRTSRSTRKSIQSTTRRERCKENSQ